MKERMGSIKSSFKNDIVAAIKGLNYNAIFGIVIGILVAVTSLSIYIEKNMVYMISVNSKPIGYAKETKGFEEVLDSIAKTDGRDFTSSIDIEKTSNPGKKFLTTNEMEKAIRQELNLKMPGVIMYADGVEIARVADLNAVNQIRDKILEYYTPKIDGKSVAILSKSIREKITTYSTLVEPSDIMDVNDAVQKIINGRGMEKTYTVKKGDTIWDIALKNNISVEQLKLANPSLNIDRINIDDVIKLAVNLPYLNVEMIVNVKADEPIPYTTKFNYDKSKTKGYKKTSQSGKSGKAEVEKKVTIVNGEVVDENVIKTNVLVAAVQEVIVVGSKQPVYTASSSTGQFMWPTRGVITSRYGRRWGELHTGLDIAVPRGTPVAASDSGVVSFAGWHGGYGYCVMINHKNGYQTLYGHLSKIYVKPGQSVSKGQKIAASGSTGRSTGPHVHFEVRKNGDTQNPQRYLK